jgi:hypothetical protein
MSGSDTIPVVNGAGKGVSGAYGAVGAFRGFDSSFAATVSPTGAATPFGSVLRGGSFIGELPLPLG